MKRIIRILFFFNLSFYLINLTGISYGAELKTEVYRLADKTFTPFTTDEVLLLYTKEEYSNLMIDLLRFKISLGLTLGLREPDYDEVPVASVEIQAEYPGLLDIEPFYFEIKKIAGGLGGNVAVFINALGYEKTTKISEVGARVYRIQYRDTGKPVPNFVLSQLRSGLDQMDQFELEWSRDNFLHPEKYEARKDLDKNPFTEIRSKLHDKIWTEMGFSQSVRVITVKTKRIDSDGGVRTSTRTWSWLDKDGKIPTKLYFETFVKELRKRTLKFIEEYPQTYADYQSLYEKAYGEKYDVLEEINRFEKAFQFEEISEIKEDKEKN